MMKNPGPAPLILGLINLVAVYITARIEENEMITKFGVDYRSYMKETKRFIPFVL
jgi:protein-S-isoprenylcysteine O-methyltransferase Ste14